MLAPLLGAAKLFASTGDQLDKMRARTGFSAQALSELGFAAEQGGASIDQLDRSLAAIELACPLSRTEIVALQRGLIVRNALREGLIYMQITRGVADRDFAFPEKVAPTVVAFAQHKRIIGAPAAETGVAAISVPDLRWVRRDIKSIALLAQLRTAVERDPRDLTSARKYLGIYLSGARAATEKFVALYAETGDMAARADYEALLADLQTNFDAGRREMLLDDRADLDVEIEVLRDRLQAELPNS